MHFFTLITHNSQIILCSDWLLIEGWHFLKVGYQDFFFPAICSTGNLIPLISSCEAAFNCFPAFSPSVEINGKYWVHAAVHSHRCIVGRIIWAWKRGQWGCFTLRSATIMHCNATFCRASAEQARGVTCLHKNLVTCMCLFFFSLKCTARHQKLWGL